MTNSNMSTPFLVIHVVFIVVLIYSLAYDVLSVHRCCDIFFKIYNSFVFLFSAAVKWMKKELGVLAAQKVQNLQFWIYAMFIS